MSQNVDMSYMTNIICLQGVSSDYGAVIEHLSASQMKEDGMKRWLQALQLCVSRLGREHDKLVSATLVRDLTCTVDVLL